MPPGLAELELELVQATLFFFFLYRLVALIPSHHYLKVLNLSHLF